MFCWSTFLSMDAKAWYWALSLDGWFIGACLGNVTLMRFLSLVNSGEVPDEKIGRFFKLKSCCNASQTDAASFWDMGSKTRCQGYRNESATAYQETRNMIKTWLTAPCRKHLKNSEALKEAFQCKKLCRKVYLGCRFLIELIIITIHHL